MKMAEEALNLGKKVSVDDVKSKKLTTWNPLNKIIGRKKDKLDFVQKSNVDSVVEELRNLKSKFQDLKEKEELIGELYKSYPSK